MSFQTLFSSPNDTAGLTDLHLKHVNARTSLLRIRSDRVRLARSGWRPRVPSETKLVRAAEWQVMHGGEESARTLDFDLVSRFVPTEKAFQALISGLEEARGAEKRTRVFVRGLELEEPRFSIGGRPVCAAFFDLVLVLSRNPDALIVLPKVDGYQEARFWAEIGRDLEASLGLHTNSIRFQAGIETLGGAVEAEEILFELKDSVVGMLYDARLDRFDSLLLQSGMPHLPADDPARDPWMDGEVVARTENLRSLATKRGLRLELRSFTETARPASESGTFTCGALTIDALHAKAFFAFRYLRDWFDGNAAPEEKDWIDFDLARAVLWTAIHSGFLREEIYEGWREGFGPQPFAAGSAEDAAIRALDPLVRTAIFSDTAKTLVSSILLEREKTRSVRDLRMA